MVYVHEDARAENASGVKQCHQLLSLETARKNGLTRWVLGKSRELYLHIIVVL